VGAGTRSTDTRTLERPILPALRGAPVTAASMERAWRLAAIPENGTSNQSHAAVPVPKYKNLLSRDAGASGTGVVHFADPRIMARPSRYVRRSPSGSTPGSFG
jgi:hypothetical protein